MTLGSSQCQCEHTYICIRRKHLHGMRSQTFTSTSRLGRPRNTSGPSESSVLFESTRLVIPSSPSKMPLGKALIPPPCRTSEFLHMHPAGRRINVPALSVLKVHSSHTIGKQCVRTKTTRSTESRECMPGHIAIIRTSPFTIQLLLCRHSCILFSPFISSE